MPCDQCFSQTMKDNEFFVDELIHTKGLKYGHPAKFFRQVSKAWSAILGEILDDDIQPYQAVAMMLMFKTIRYNNLPGDGDTLLDIKGYTKILSILEEFEQDPT